MPAALHGQTVDGPTKPGGLVDRVLQASGKLVAIPYYSAGRVLSWRAIRLSCATSGATIRYTTNGVEADGTSAVYSLPIAVSSSITIKAKAFVGDDSSYTVTAAYSITASSPTFNPPSGIYNSPRM